MHYLEENHIQKLFKAYQDFEDIPNFSKVASVEEVLENNASMSITQYIKRQVSSNSSFPFGGAFSEWQKSGDDLKASIAELFNSIQ